MTGRQPAGAVDEDVIGTLDLIADKLDAAAERADDALAGGTPAKRLVHQLIDANRLIAAAARGQEVTS